MISNRTTTDFIVVCIICFSMFIGSGCQNGSNKPNGSTKTEACDESNTNDTKNGKNMEQEANNNKHWGGALICVVVLAAGLFLCMKQRRKKNNEQVENTNETIDTEESNTASDNGGSTETIDNDNSEPNEPNTPQESKDNGENADNKKAHEEAILNSDSAFAFDNDNWSIVGASVMGQSHIELGIPCQDRCGYKYLGKGWGIAVVSDGSGSAKHSEFGSQIIVKSSIEHLEKLILIKKLQEREELPTNDEWTNFAYNILRKVYKDLEENRTNNSEIEDKDINATVIILIHTPHGLLCTHVGDGRAGYRNMQGEWKPLIRPHEGEYAGETYYLTTNFWSVPYFINNGVFVPQSIVIREQISGFVIMSDGCENIVWNCLVKNETTQKYYDMNTPRNDIFENLRKDLLEEHSNGISLNKRINRWHEFLSNGFPTEPDDKTMILGINYVRK